MVTENYYFCVIGSILYMLCDIFEDTYNIQLQENIGIAEIDMVVSLTDRG